MNIAALIHFGAAAITFTLGGLVLRTNPGRPANQVYVLLSLASGSWLVCLAFAFLATTPGVATAFIRDSHSVGASIPLVCDWLRLAIIHPDRRFRDLIRLNPFFLAVTLVFILVAQTPWIIQSATIPDPLFQTILIPEAVLGNFYFLYGGFYLLALSLLTVRFWKSRRQAQEMQRAELNFACLGAVASIAAAVVVSIFHPMLSGTSQATQFSALTVMILNFTIAYGIATRRIMDMAYLFRLLTAYSLLAVYLSLLYLAIWWPLHMMLKLWGRSGAFFPGLIASVAVAFSLAPVHGFMQRFANRLFAKTAPLNMDTVLQLTSRLLYSISTIEKLLADFSATITRIVGTDKVCVLLLEDGCFKQKHPLPAGTTALALDKGDALPSALRTHGEVIVPSVLRRLNPNPAMASACKTIEDLHFSVAIGLHSKEGLEGIFLLGPKLNGHIYGAPEQHAIQLLCNHLAVALTNARLYSQIRRTDRLASLGTLAAGMAHEIKNPLVSIKTFTQLLPERYEDQDFRETFSSLVGGEVKRIDSIVNQLLRFSRPAKPVLAPTSLHEMLNNALKLIQEQLRTKSIQLSVSFTSCSDLIDADGDQLSQAFINFLLNAIESMPEGGTLNVSTTFPAREPNTGLLAGENIRVFIQDTGVGIAPEHIPHIFDPFFTTKSQGTGLGLSVAHGIIQEHSGTIEILSEPGRGTTFILTFPLHKESARL